MTRFLLLVLIGLGIATGVINIIERSLAILLAVNRVGMIGPIVHGLGRLFGSPKLRDAEPGQIKIRAMKTVGSSSNRAK